MIEQKILVKAEDIAQKVKELALRISIDYKKQPFMLVSILKGAHVFTADLERALYQANCTHQRLCFITLRTYVTGTESSKEPKLVHDIDFDPKDKHILLVDDVFDTGVSLGYLAELFTERGAASVKSCVLISKSSKREAVYEPEYVGFVLPDVWLEGYGMDTDERGRANPDIIIGPSTLETES